MKNVEMAEKCTGHGGSVLVVEDDDTQRELMEIMITTLGFEAQSARSAAEAISTFGADPARFRLVFMDCRLRDAPGWEVSRALRGIQERHETSLRIVALTGLDDESDKRRCLASGMDDFIVKPLGLEALRSVLHRYI